MGYLYETHMHTCQSSACGRSTGREHADFYKSIGYQGIIVTDHFFGGNTAVDRKLPWEKKVENFCKGYEDALEEGKKIGLDVFFGWEQGYGDDEYLVYGLDKAWLLAHPEIEHCSRRRQYELVHEGGGCVVQAHPFRMRDYMRYIRLGLTYCDGAEAANGGNRPVNDRYAYAYAKEFHLPMTAGSDNHFSVPGSGRPIYGVELEKKLETIGDFVQLILNHGKIGLHVPQDRFVPEEKEEALVSFFLNDREELVPTGRVWP